MRATDRTASLCRHRPDTATPLAVGALVLALGVTAGCRRSGPVDAGRDTGAQAAAPSPSTKGEKRSRPPSRQYTFSSDWVSTQIPTWQRVLAAYRGRPNTRYLEIGVFEGRSLIWMLENVFTDPSSSAVGVDVMLRPRLSDNLEASGQASRVQIVTGLSAAAMRPMALESFDVIYVDGSHRADDALTDAVLAWGLLKPEGLILFDDYQWNGAYVTDPQEAWPENLRPKIAIDAFMSAFRDTIEVVDVGAQVTLRKKVHPCNAAYAWECSPVGRYGYCWIERRLQDGTARPVALSPHERRLIERIARLRDATGHYRLPADVRQDPLFTELAARLDLQLD